MTDDILCQVEMPRRSVAEPAPSVSRSESIVGRLREAIFDGRYPPGTPLREIKLAREMAVSQATIRESLQKLENAGLVVRVPNIGTTVVRLTPRDIRERVELRAELEVWAAKKAAQRMSENDCLELERLLQVLMTAVKADRYYEAAQADLAFHRYVWGCSGSQTLATTLEHLTVPLLAFVSLLRHTGFEHLPDVVAAHEPLIAALRSGDEVRIEEEFREGATQSYRQFMEAGGSSRKAFAFGYMDVGT